MKKLFFPAIVFLTVILSGCTTQQPQLPVELGKEFYLGEGQTASLVIGEPEIDRGYYYNFTLTKLISKSKSAMVEVEAITLTVKGEPGFVDPPASAFIDSEIVLREGEERTMGEGFYAIQIENTGIEAGENATFVVRSVSGEGQPDPKEIPFPDLNEIGEQPPELPF